MLVETMHRQNNILNTALHASAARNDVILNNIANNDLPGYKAKSVDFEDTLIQALDNWKRTGVLDLSNAKPTVRTESPYYNYRIDKNNVDMEMEMVRLYQNSVKYDAMVNSVLNNSRRMNLAISGR